MRLSSESFFLLASSRLPDTDVATDQSMKVRSNELDFFDVIIIFRSNGQYNLEAGYFAYLRWRCSMVDAWLVLATLNNESCLSYPISIQLVKPPSANDVVVRGYILLLATSSNIIVLEVLLFIRHCSDSLR